jgi:hypothetical protein
MVGEDEVDTSTSEGIWASGPNAADQPRPRREVLGELFFGSVPGKKEK